MKKADKICILLIMAACVLFYIPLWFAYDAQENREVVVKVRNKEVLRTDLMKDGSYTVELNILEPLTTESIFSLSIKSDTRHNATTACKRWRELAANIYEYVYSKIIDN